MLNKSRSGPAMPPSRGITRRAALASLGGAAAAGAVAACGQTREQAPSGGQAATGNVSWMYSANPQTSGFDRIEEAFRAKFPSVKLEVLHTPDDYDNKLLAMYSAGNPPDVLRLNDDYIKGYKVRNLIAALDLYLKASGVKRDDYYPAVYDFPVQDGKHYAWFLGANPRLIFYNADLFRKAGVPLPPAKWEPSGWTFDHFVDVAKRLTQLTASPPVYGASLYDDTGNEQTFSINNGSPTGIYSKDGLKFTLADPPGYEAIQWIADLTHKHRVQPTRQVASDNRGIGAMFNNQLLAMRFTNTTSILDMRRNAAFTWDVAPVPMKAKRMMEASIQTYALAVGAKNPDNGWRLLHFFTDQEVARIFIDTGYVIPAKKAFAKDYIDASRGKPPANMALIVESFNYQTQPNQTLDTQGARRIYRGDNLNEIWDGKVTARDGLTRVRAAVEAAIAPK
jgi:multiple sugar transport system substrate-binding protein